MSKRLSEDVDAVKFVALGGGSEVGRSCHIVEYKGKTVMLDAGVHPAYTGMASLPFYDDYDLSQVDVLLISHFHLDHAASLPYVMQRTGFKGRVFMTHPTKAIYRWLLSDFVRVSNAGSGDNSELYTDEDLDESFANIEAIDFYSTQDVGGIKFTAYHAGHVLGAAMYLIEISGLKILFTGDYSREQDRHLHAAEVPPVRPDILICESTFGTGILPPRLEKETKLISLIHSTLNKGGRCLLPVFSLGNTQELLLILEEYWEQNPELEGVSIFYASNLARKCMAVYQTFINMMNEDLKRKYLDTKRNPFHFKHVTPLRSLDKFDDVGPCVMLASPGMLQNGVSRQLLERWAPDPRNSLILTGYSVEGTMAKHIITEPAEITSINNSEIKIPRRISVDEISFAAHVDFRQNSEFIDLVGAPHVILVHGETNAMGRLKSALLSKYSSLRGTLEEVHVYNPRNCLDLVIPFKTQKIARTLGLLANHDPSPGEHVQGLLVQNQRDFRLSFVAEADVTEFTGLTTPQIMEQQTVIVNAQPELVRFYLLSMFGDDLQVESPTKWIVLDKLVVHTDGKFNYSVTWEADEQCDMFADSILALLLGIDSSKSAVKMTSKSCEHNHNADDKLGRQHQTESMSEVKSEESDGVKIEIKNEVKEEETEEEDSKLADDADQSLLVGHSRGNTRIEQLKSLLTPHFGDSFTCDPSDLTSGQVCIDGTTAHINFETMEVECTSNLLKQRVHHILNLCASIVDPLSGKRRENH